jgi:hypothetical protein
MRERTSKTKKKILLGAWFLHECKPLLRTCKELHRAQKKWRPVPIEFNAGFLHTSANPFCARAKNCTGCKKNWRPVPIEFNGTVTLILYVRTFAAKKKPRTGAKVGEYNRRSFVKSTRTSEEWENKLNAVPRLENRIYAGVGFIIISMRINEYAMIDVKQVDSTKQEILLRGHYCKSITWCASVFSTLDPSHHHHGGTFGGASGTGCALSGLCAGVVHLMHPPFWSYDSVISWRESCPVLLMVCCAASMQGSNGAPPVGPDRLSVVEPDSSGTGRGFHHQGPCLLSHFGTPPK